MTDKDQARLHAIVEGRVQGVGFRMFVVDIAEMLGVTGWVRNLWDDTVEVTAEGDRAALERLLAALRRGPRAAFVSKVTEEWGPPTGEFKRFWVTGTY
jgi:acylphosphatase